MIITLAVFIESVLVVFGCILCFSFNKIKMKKQKQNKHFFIVDELPKSKLGF